MPVYSLKKGLLNKFVKAASAGREFIAPVKTDIVRFEPVADAGPICLSEQSFFPVKEYFFTKREVLLVWDGRRIAAPAPQSKRRVFFGLRRCDLNGIMKQDIALLAEPNSDPYYAALRRDCILIGFHCNAAPSEYCFCGSMKLQECGDVMFFDRGGVFLVEALSAEGDEFIKSFGSLFAISKESISAGDKAIPGTDKLEKPDISALYDNAKWKEGVDMCLSCGACTALCPTCYCFEASEETTVAEPGRHKRVRSWSSCQLESFTKVAGGHVFRQKRDERFKHRIYHQLDYFREKNGTNLCVGCGRCITGCPTRIDFVKIINGM